MRAMRAAAVEFPQICVWLIGSLYAGAQELAFSSHLSKVA